MSRERLVLLRRTFLRELPRFYGELEDQLAATDPSWNETELPSFLRIGSWIGGDRDGNPFVTAEVLRQALRMHSKRALSFYLDEVHQLGGELSLDGRLVRVSERAQRTGGSVSRPLAAPPGRALPARHVRHLRAPCSNGHEPRPWRRAATRRGRGPPYPNPAELAADLMIASLARGPRLRRSGPRPVAQSAPGC